MRVEGIHQIHCIKNRVSKEKVTMISNNISTTADVWVKFETDMQNVAYT